MLLKQCSMCGKLIPYGSSYCERCKPLAEEKKQAYKKKRNRVYNQKRNKEEKSFYNSEAWKLLSQKKLQDVKYKCEECGAIADEVHHIKPIQSTEGWLRRLDYNNLKCLCVKCHNKAHKRF